MGLLRTPLHAKLFIGMLSPESGLLSACADILSAEYGPLDLESEIMPWEITDYYREEMGSGIRRKFIFFSTLIDPGSLPAVKRFTNAVEDRFAQPGPSGSRRRINLDPGYVTEAKVVLASTKDFAHRVYIGDGIYGEVTLRYSSREHSFGILDHTYFDFRTEQYRLLFNRARDILRSGLNQAAKGGAVRRRDDVR